MQHDVIEQKRINERKRLAAKFQRMMRNERREKVMDRVSMLGTWALESHGAAVSAAIQTLIVDCAQEIAGGLGDAQADDLVEGGAR
jgi:hypothetical protein